MADNNPGLDDSRYEIEDNGFSTYLPLDTSLESDRDLNTTLNDTRNLRKCLGDTFAQMDSSHKTSSKVVVVPSKVEVSKKKTPLGEVVSKDNRKAGPCTQSVAKKTTNFEEIGEQNAITVNETITEEEEFEFSVCLRIRPCNGPSTIEVLPKGDDKTRSSRQIRTHAPQTSNAFKVARSGSVQVVKEFDFASVFGPETTQHGVYRQTVQPYIRGLFEGQSALVFCYGITNAGKTYTVTGPEQALQISGASTSWGLVPRAMQEIVDICQNRHSKDTTLHLSYYEIYNERVYDLLHDKSKFPSNGAVSLKMISHRRVGSVSGGLDLISQARKNRHSGTNCINAESSRSHAICQLRVCNKATDREADLWIVDLAGSERTKRTGGARLQEATAINQSLMSLNRCLTTLRLRTTSNDVVIPWRESKLTQLFAAHWTGPRAKRTTMLVNVNPSAVDFDETQHVLSYAAVARDVKLESKVPPATALPKTVEYGLDGRRKLAKVISKVVSKLSPKRSRNNTNQKRKMPVEDGLKNNEKQKYGYQPVTRHASKRIKPNQEASVRVESGESRQLSSLKMELSVAQADASHSKNRCRELQIELESIETSVRDEVAEEMSTQMHAMRREYDRIISGLRARLLESSGDSSEEKQLELERANKKIEQLRDQVEECEAEMQRMQVDHQSEQQRLLEENSQLRHQLEQAAANGDGSVGPSDEEESIEHTDEEREQPEEGKHKDLVRDDNKGQQDRPSVATDPTEDIHSETDGLKSRSTSVQMNVLLDNLPTSVHQPLTTNEADSADDSSLSISQQGSPTDNSMCVAAEEEASNEQVSEESDIESDVEETPEEANTDMEDSFAADEAVEMEERDPVLDDDENQEEPTRRTRRASTRIQALKKPCSKEALVQESRKVFGSILNTSYAVPEDTSLEAGFMRPKSTKPKFDPATGLFQRPKGRKPTGAEDWDKKRGAWRMSMV